MDEYKSYPNLWGHYHGKDKESIGILRLGLIMENDDTKKSGLAGYVAAVTYERDGWVRCYIYSQTPKDALFPNVPLWIGPYQLHSEEIEEMEATI